MNQPGDVVFYNDAASTVLGQRFEETGPLSAQDWVEAFGPFDEEGKPLPVDYQPLTPLLRRGRPGHAALRIRSATGAEYDIQASGLPIVGLDGFQGAMIFFWKTDEEEE